MSESATVKQMFQMLRHAGMKPVYFAVPTLLAVLSALFEGLSVVLLVPIVHGLFNHDMSVLKANPQAQMALGFLPAAWTASDQALLLLTLVVFVVAVVLKNILRYASLYCMSLLAFRTAHHLRKQMFLRYLNSGKLFFDRSTIGHHNTVLSIFTEIATNPLVGFDRYLSQIFSLIVCFTIMCTISLKLTLFAIPLFALLHFSVSFIIKKIRAISRQSADATKVLQKQSHEILTMIPVVLAHNAQSREQDRFKELSDKLSAVYLRNSKFYNLVTPINELETLVVMLVLFSLILFVVRDPNLTQSVLIVYFYLVMNSALKFGTLSGFRSQLAAASGPVQEILQVFDPHDKFVVPDGTVPFDGLENSIDFKNFEYAYPGNTSVLRDISFSVKKGTMTAIVGPTGSGKTTLVNVIMRYYDCEPGMLFVDGKDIRDYTLASLRAHIGLVSQDVLLFNDTIRSNIAYGVDNASDEDVAAAVREASLEEFIEKLPNKLNTLVGDRGVQLSGGEKQRVSIARALLKGSDILILDEATSSLDSRTEALIQTAIDRVTKGKTSIVIAHRLSTIKHADRIVVIDQGECVEQGTLDELLEKKGAFYKLWEAQKFV